MSALRLWLALFAISLALFTLVQMVDKIVAGITACASHEIPCPVESLR